MLTIIAIVIQKMFHLKKLKKKLIIKTIEINLIL